MRIVGDTMKTMLGPMRHLITITFAILYTFSLIGMAMFGGTITTDAEPIVLDSSV